MRLRIGKVRRAIFCFFLTLIVVAVASCSSPLQDNQIEKAKNLPIQFQSQLESISASQKDFQAKLDSGDFNDVKQAVVDLKLSDEFTRQKSALVQCQKNYSDSVEPILKRNSKEDDLNLAGLIGKANQCIEVAKSSTEGITKSLELLKVIGKDRGTAVAQALSVKNDLDLSLNAIRDQEKELRKRYSEQPQILNLATVTKDALDLWSRVQTQFDVISSGLQTRPDAETLKRVIKAYQVLNTIKGQLPEILKRTADDLKELDSTKIVTLTGLDFQCHVLVTRKPDEDHQDLFTQFDRTLTTSLEVCEQFLQVNPEQPIYRYEKAEGQIVTDGPWGIPNYALLNITPSVGTDNDDNFAVELYLGAEVNYLAELTTVESDGEPKVEKQSVSPDWFNKHKGDIGTAIWQKGPGQLAENAIDIPAPPAIHLVGNPSTGEWVKRDGMDYWHFTGRYSRYSEMYHYDYCREEMVAFERRPVGTAFYGINDNRHPVYGANSPSSQKYSSRVNPAILSDRFNKLVAKDIATSGIKTSPSLRTTSDNLNLPSNRLANQKVGGLKVGDFNRKSPGSGSSLRVTGTKPSLSERMTKASSRTPSTSTRATGTGYGNSTLKQSGNTPSKSSGSSGSKPSKSK